MSKPKNLVILTNKGCFMLLESYFPAAIATHVNLVRICVTKKLLCLLILVSFKCQTKRPFSVAEIFLCNKLLMLCHT